MQNYFTNARIVGDLDFDLERSNVQQLDLSGIERINGLVRIKSRHLTEIDLSDVKHVRNDFIIVCDDVGKYWEMG